MAKYYVECGTLKLVVQAEGARCAALWAVHRALAQVVPMDEGPAEARMKRALGEGYQILDDQLWVNQRGFARRRRCFRTRDIVMEWLQLIMALEKIETLAVPAASEAQR